MDARIYSYLEELAAKSGVQEKPAVKLLIFKAALWHEKKPEFTGRVERMLIELAEKEPTSFLRPPPGELTGPLHLGFNQWSGQVGLEPSSLAHALILGMTQVGKTTMLARLIDQFIKKTGIATLSFDPKKSLRGIVSDHQAVDVARLDELKFNPLKVNFADEGMQKRWLFDCWGIITYGGDLLTGSRSFGYKVLQKTFDDFKNKKRFPSMYDLLDKVNEEKKRYPPSSPTYRYADRVANRLEALLFAFSDSLDCSQGIPLEYLLRSDSHLILEWDGLDPSLAKTFALLLIQGLYHRKLVEGDRGQGIDIAIFIDEAEEFLSQGINKAKGVPFISKLLERGKELGLAIILALHHTRIHPSIRENAASRFSFSLSSSKDVQNVAQDMGLTEEQADAIEDLEVGELVAKVKGKWDEPFTVMVEPINLEVVSDKEASEQSQEFKQRMEQSVKPRETKEPQAAEEETEEEKELDLEEEVLLANIAQSPFLSLTDRQDKLGWGAGKLNRKIKKLRGRYIRKKRLTKGGRGSTITLLELTGRALDYLEENGIEAQQGRGRGTGIIHTFWLLHLITYLEKNDYDVREEVEVNGTVSDLVAADKEGNLLAAEVEVSDAGNTLNKLEKLLSGVDKVLIVCNSKKLVEDFQRGLEEISFETEEVYVRRAQEMDLPEEG